MNTFLPCFTSIDPSTQTTSHYSGVLLSFTVVVTLMHPRSGSPETDRLQLVIDGVYQETMTQQRRSYSARQSEVRNLGRVSRNLGRTTIGDKFDSDSTHIDTLLPSTTAASANSTPPAKKRKLHEGGSSSSSLSLSVSTATGIDPVDFTMVKNTTFEEATTVAKIKKLVCVLFPHELNALKAPEKLKVLTYRFKGPGEAEWTAIESAQQLTTESCRLRELAGNGRIRLQVCVLEEGTMDMSRPLLLGRAAGKLKGEEFEVEEVEEDEENAIVMVTKRQKDAWVSDEMSLAAVEGSLDAANEMLEEQDEEIKTLKVENDALRERLRET